ncbi:MAG: tetratricopeptide repeat protein [Balneolaceae bacterium]
MSTLRLTYVLAIVACLLTALPPEDAYAQQSMFDDANEYFQEGDVTEALKLYQRIESQGQISGALYLNMGISYMQIDSLGKSKYYLMKARNFPETRSRAVAGLDYVEEQFSRQSAVMPKLPWQRALDWMNRMWGAPTVSGIGIVLLNMGVGLFISLWFVSWGRPWIRKTSIAFAVSGVFFILISFYLQYLDNRYSEAVMVNDQTTVMETPNSQSETVLRAYEGYALTVDHRESEGNPGWMYVRMSNGQYGWIPKKDILIL